MLPIVVVVGKELPDWAIKLRVLDAITLIWAPGFDEAFEALIRQKADSERPLWADLISPN